MFRSIRWNLLGWYSALLLAVLAGFGVTLYHRLETLSDQRVDTELASAAQLIAQRIRPAHRTRGHSAARPEPETIDLPETLLQRFGADENEAAYALLWLRDAHAPPRPMRPRTCRPRGLSPRKTRTARASAAAAICAR